jgi:hypothetical protein
LGAVQLLEGGSRGQNGWYLTGASRNVVEILSDEKPSDTRRSGELRFNFMLAVPNELTLKFLGLKQRIHRILKGQCRASGYKECVIVNR